MTKEELISDIKKTFKMEDSSVKLVVNYVLQLISQLNEPIIQDKSLQEAIEKIKKLEVFDIKTISNKKPIVISGIWRVDVLQILSQVKLQGLELSKEEIKLLFDIVKYEESKYQQMCQNGYCEEDEKLPLLKSKLEAYLERLEGKGDKR